LISWVISGLGAISLALVFALLCAKFPETGGPHVYVKHAFGPTAAFFVGWTYWVSSWVSSTAVTVASIGYLAPLFHNDIQSIHLLLEITLILVIMLINLRGVTTAGRVELLLTIVKIIALLAIPVAGLFFFDRNNFIVSEEISTLTMSQVLARSTLLTLWCFIGLESATAPAGSVNNPA
ncbi:MAG: amino acid permease, partial [Wolbachia sp.]